MVYMDNMKCARIKQSFKEMSTIPQDYLLAWMEEDREVLEKLSNELETPLNHFMEVIYFSEALKAQIFIDPTIPEWIVEVYYNNLEKYVEAAFASLHGTEELRKLRGGPMVTEILANMEAIANNDESGKKFLIYSAHDTTILSLAYALRVEDQIPGLPNYSDTFMVDLLDNGYVQVIYMNTGGVIPTRKVINVHGCDVSCPLSTFREAVKDMIVEDWDALCAL